MEFLSYFYYDVGYCIFQFECLVSECGFLKLFRKQRDNVLIFPSFTENCTKGSGNLRNFKFDALRRKQRGFYPVKSDSFQR